MLTTEVAIIGAGPIGLELAVRLKQLGVNYLQFDAGQVGQTISWFAPQTHFFSSNERIAIAGVPLQTLDQSKATREQYLQYLREVVALHNLKILAYEPISLINKVDDGFELTTTPRQGERHYRAKRLVIATGGTARPRMLNIPGENLPHVSHYLEDPHKYFNQRILVVGGRNSAVEAALRCHNALADVTLSYRGAGFDANSIKYWLLPEINSLLQSRRIRGYFNTVVREITPTHVQLVEPAGETAIDVDVDFVLLMTGYIADMTLLRQAGVELLGNGQIPVFNQNTMETNIRGLYVAGTAVGGTQERYKLFIENCHVHVDRIATALTGKPSEAKPPTFTGPLET